MSEALRIWAPRAKRVEVLVAGERIGTAPEHGGWWRGPALDDGVEYLVSLDGGPARPDPRSRFQPHGVHGPSQVVDIAAPAHGLRAPVLQDAVIYELHVGTFTNAESG